MAIHVITVADLTQHGPKFLKRTEGLDKLIVHLRWKPFFVKSHLKLEKMTEPHFLLNVN